MPIPDRTVESLRRLKAESDGSPYLFVDFERLGHINSRMRDGLWRDRAETCNNVLRGFQVIQRRAAESTGAQSWTIGNIHDLRRTYGTRLADVVPMHVLQKWMGHSDVSVTARFYLGQSEHHAALARGAFEKPTPMT
ncbi:MAG: site-specific integrase [Myxococcales bacterium]|nr:site-specific integrase [Myxococcales bacterium]